MRLLTLAFCVVLLAACGKDPSKERFEAIENRLQSGEFHLATLAEVEPRLQNLITESESRSSEWFRKIETLQGQNEDEQYKIFTLEMRLEQAEAWIAERERREEKERVEMTPDGEINASWKELNTKCALDQAGQAQTTLNFLVRIDRYMSDFPVHHAVSLPQDDPLECMTANIAGDNTLVKQAYRDRELSILKSRDQWLGYRIDRSWEVRPEKGPCQISCCTLALDGTWSCQWGWEGGRWECEYDVEGWRDYTKRWYRHCDYLPNTRDFYVKPYLMQKIEEKKEQEQPVAVPEAFNCVVDLVWENRIYCLSHTHYPIMMILLPWTPVVAGPAGGESARAAGEEAGRPAAVYERPAFPRYSLVRVSGWDVLYKDEWTSNWVVTGVYEPEFPGQRSGLKVELVQSPTCCPAEDPEAVLKVETALTCIPPARQEEALPALINENGFKSRLDFETQRLGMEAAPAWKVKLDEVHAAGCPSPQP